tara:strand:- start:1648 stop:2043 length:396 start_codon:yes stop_codon:yes gene_type:complete
MSEINSNIGPSPAIKVLTTQPSVNPEQAVTATNVVGGIASVTQLSVSGVSTLGIITVSSGIISSTTGIVTYLGDGSQLTGVVATDLGSIPELDVVGVSTLNRVKVDSGIITATSGVVTFTGDITSLDGGSF